MTHVHPVLDLAFQALNRSGARWCLLRGRDRLAAPTGDVDLLFHPDDVPPAREALEGVGFVTLRQWADGTQNFFLAYDPDSDHWLYVHAMTQLGFGDFHSLVWPRGAEDVLLRRRMEGGIPEPDPDDAFWITLYHALVDKGRVADHHGATLRTTAEHIDRGGAGSTFARSVLPEGMRIADVTTMAEAGDAAGLEALAPEVVVRWKRRDPTHGYRRRRYAASLRNTKLAEIVTRRGIDVALLAPDGAGKSTLIDGLGDRLFFRVKTYYLGLEGGRFAGSGPSRIPLGGFLARILHAWRTWWTARYDLSRRRIVLYDRYPYEGRLPDPTPRSMPSRVRRGLLARCLPAPSLVVVLDAPGEVLHARKAEHPVERLERDRQGYLDLARRHGWAVVDATGSAEEVRAAVTAEVWRAYHRRHGGR